MNDREERLVHQLTNAIEGLTLEVCGLRAVVANGTVSRCDLAASEARITQAIGNAFTAEDQKALDSLAEIARRKTLRLERLDARIPRQ